MLRSLRPARQGQRLTSTRQAVRPLVDPGKRGAAVVVVTPSGRVVVTRSRTQA